jgi:hypothetical protein
MTTAMREGHQRWLAERAAREVPAAIERCLTTLAYIRREAIAWSAYCEHDDRERYVEERGDWPHVTATDNDFKIAREAGVAL